MVEMRGAADHRLQGMLETDLFEREKTQPTVPTSQPQLGTNDMERLESLFTEASLDRSRTMALKVELDRLGVFDNYEDRFLDLFRECS